MGSVRGAGREISHERAVRRDRLLLANPAHALVGEIAGELIAFLRRLRRLDRRRVADQRRIELVGLAADEAVEIVESLIGRPVVERTRRARLVIGHIVVLAEPRAGVARLFQKLGEGRAALGNDAAIARIARRHLLDDAGRDGVMIAAGQQSGARRRAQRRRMELVEEQAALEQSFGGRACARGRRSRSSSRSRHRRAERAGCWASPWAPACSAGSRASTPSRTFRSWRSETSIPVRASDCGRDERDMQASSHSP